MIERKFVAENIKIFQIQEYIEQSLKGVGHSHTKLQKTPLGEKITIYTSRPGLIVGRKGQNIKNLTSTLKKKFNFENPQIEISEVTELFLDATIVADMIASSLERFGTSKFKGVGHKMLANVMNSGALGVEILISGKVPSSRAKRWRFYSGYMKKCGDISIEGVKHAIAAAHLKTGAVGINVRIMPPDIKLPDNINLREPDAVVEEKNSEEQEEKEAGKKTKKKEKKGEKDSDKKTKVVKKNSTQSRDLSTKSKAEDAAETKEEKEVTEKAINEAE